MREELVNFMNHGTALDATGRSFILPRLKKNQKKTTTQLLMTVEYDLIFRADVEYISKETLLENLLEEYGFLEQRIVGGAKADENFSRAQDLWTSVTKYDTKTKLDSFVREQHEQKANNIKDVGVSEDVLLSDIANIVGHCESFVGNGRSALNDRIFVKNSLRRLNGLCETKDDADRYDRRRQVVSSVHVYVPCDIVKAVKFVDVPGFKDTNPLNKLQQKQILESADIVFGLMSKDLRANSPMLDALQEQGVLCRMLQSRVHVGLMSMCERDDNDIGKDILKGDKCASGSIANADSDDAELCNATFDLLDESIKDELRALGLRDNCGRELFDNNTSVFCAAPITYQALMVNHIFLFD